MVLRTTLVCYLFIVPLSTQFEKGFRCRNKKVYHQELGPTCDLGGPLEKFSYEHGSEVRVSKTKSTRSHPVPVTRKNFK